MSDIDAINTAADVFAARLWDAITEFMEVSTETIPPTRTPTSRWAQMSQQTQEKFVRLLLDQMLAAPLVQAVGRLVRQDREAKN